MTVSLALRYVCEATTNGGNHLTAPTLCRTITHLSSPQSSHLLKSVNVANHHACRANMPRSRVLLVVRAVMWCAVVAYDATPSHGVSRWKATCLPCTSVPLPTTTLSTPTARSTVPSVRLATLLVSPTTEKQPSVSRTAKPRHRGS